MADQQTIKTYNLMAQEYDEETVDFWSKFPYKIFHEFEVNLPNNGLILDIGSGPGRDALILKDHGFQVICLDASKAMIELTKVKGLTSVLSDFLQIPFPNDKFDGAWAYTSLLHVPKDQMELALKEASRVIKSGGILGLGLIEGNTEGLSTSSGVTKPRYFSFYQKDEIKDLLMDTGFEIFYFEQFQPRSKNYLNFLARKI